MAMFENYSPEMFSYAIWSWLLIPPFPTDFVPDATIRKQANKIDAIPFDVLKNVKISMLVN